MPNRCCVSICSGNGTNFFRFPKDIERRIKWIESTEVRDRNGDNKRVCNNHFVESDYKDPSTTGRLVLKDNVIPSIQVPNPGSK